jgi:caffeoyl-CoA O-methyltransferase
MSRILEVSIEKYLDSLLPARDPVVREMERYAAKNKVPIVGPACARVLYQLAKFINARRVFEMGSAIGYSTLWLAQAVGPKGIVFYTDSDPANGRRAEGYLSRAGVRERVKILVGDALEQLELTRGEFDLIFNDVDKVQYPKVLRLAPPRLRPGGIFVTDNVLWSGRVSGPHAATDPATVAIQKFNRQLFRSKDLFTTVIPLRDGLAVARKAG